MAWLAWAVTVGVMSAQPVTPPPEPADVIEGVTVTAPRPAPPDPKVLEAFVDELAVPNIHGRVAGQVARWITPVCPGVMGTTTRAGRYLVQRISATAKAAGAPLGRPGCQPNLIVAVTTDGDRLVRELASKHRYRLFGPGRHQELGEFVAPAQPVRWWHLSRPGPATRTTAGIGIGGSGPPMPTGVGGGAVQTGGAGLSAPEFRLDPSRIRASQSESMSAVLVVVDSRLARGASARALSAHVAMVGLARFPQQPEMREASTILNLFRTADGRAPPSDLTAYDRAYLRGLYSMRADLRYGRQRQQIESSMRRELQAVTGAPAAP